MKKKWLILIILLVVCAIVCSYIFLTRTNDVKIIIDNQSHNLKDINEVVELAKKEFHNEGIKAKLLSVEYHEKDVMDLEEELKNGSLKEIKIQNLPLHHDTTFLWNKNSVYSKQYKKICKELIG